MDEEIEGQGKAKPEEMKSDEQRVAREEMFDDETFASTTSRGFYRIEEMISASRQRYEEAKSEYQRIRSMPEQDAEARENAAIEMEEAEEDIGITIRALRDLGIEPNPFQFENDDVYFVLAKVFGAKKEDISAGDRKFLLGKGITVLEIGGKEGNDYVPWWPSCQGILDSGANYLGTDISVTPYEENPPRDEIERKEEAHPGQREEYKKVDALKVKEALGDRKVEVIYCMAFFGYPTHEISKSLRVDWKIYEEKVLDQFDGQLRDGGIIFIGARESQGLNMEEYFQNHGYRVVNASNPKSAYRYWIARKIPKLEIAASNN